MEYSSFDKYLFNELFILKKEINIYTLHIEESFSPAQFSRFIKRYEKLNIVSYHDNIINLTPFGEKWIIKNRKEIFLRHKSKKWVDIPQDWRVL